MFILVDYHPVHTDKARLLEYTSLDTSTSVGQLTCHKRDMIGETACNYTFVESLSQPCYIMAVTLLRTLIQLNGDRHCWCWLAVDLQLLAFYANAYSFSP